MKYHFAFNMAQACCYVKITTFWILIKLNYWFPLTYSQRPNNRLAREALLKIFDAFLPPSHERGRSNDSNEHTASMSVHGNEQRLNSVSDLKCFAKLEDMNEIVRSLSYRGVFDWECVRLISQIIFRFITKQPKSQGRSRPSSETRQDLDSAGSITPMYTICWSKSVDFKIFKFGDVPIFRGVTTETLRIMGG